MTLRFLDSKHYRAKFLPDDPDVAVWATRAIQRVQDQLRAERQRREWSLEYVAKQLGRGISRQEVWNLETNHMDKLPHLPILQNYALLFGWRLAIDLVPLESEEP